MSTPFERSAFSIMLMNRWSAEAAHEQDSVYTFAGGMVKLANKKFTSIKNDYCLTFSNDARVLKCDDDDDIEGISFNFTDLSEIESMVQSRVLDVIGVILNVGPMSEINLKDGKVR